MRFEYQRNHYRVRWEFDQRNRRQTTRAILEQKNTWEGETDRANGRVSKKEQPWFEVARGESHCHPGDAALGMFDRVLGQEKALDRALMGGPPPEPKEGEAPIVWAPRYPAAFRAEAWTAFKRIRWHAEEQRLTAAKCKPTARSLKRLSDAALGRLLSDLLPAAATTPTPLPQIASEAVPAAPWAIPNMTGFEPLPPGIDPKAVDDVL